ncbi:regulator [Hafnia alvei]|uniref:regulator n=1 Tax=Hafnia alvei TaxID=569 RepID=UPI0019387140|nr:regulator [Hafnia alvei]QQE43884.1 regulator [Hafnia alvei]
MNARQRYNAKRIAEFNAKKAEVNAYTSRINKAYTKLSMGLSGCSERTVKALSLPTPRAAKELEVEVKRSNHRIWYKDTNPLGSKIHAVQKSRGKSIPLI